MKKVNLDHIAEQLRPLAVEMGTLALDPKNARKHDDKSVKAIAGSLREFGTTRMDSFGRGNGRTRRRGIHRL